MAASRIARFLNESRGQKPLKSEIIEKKETGLLPIPTDPDLLAKLADELIAWSKRKTALHIEEFPLSKRFSPSRFFKAASRSDYLAEAIEFAREQLCIRRIEAVHKGELNLMIFLKSWPLYSLEMKELSLEKIKQMHEARLKNGQFLPEVTPL